MVGDILEHDVVICARHGKDGEGGGHGAGECCELIVREWRATPKVAFMRLVMYLE